MRKMPAQKPGKSKQDYQTPPEFLIAAARRLKIDAWAWDLACSPDNCVSPFGGYTVETSALDPANGWCFPGWSFLNPEWDDIGPWLEKAHAESEKGAHIAVLVPASVGANYWVEHVDGKARVLMLNGRITFVGMTQPYPKDCVLLLYGPDQIHGYEPWTWMQDLTDEERAMAKRRTGKGPKQAREKKKPFKATTRAGKKAEKIAADRATKKRGTNVVDIGSSPAARVTTFKPNGPTSTEVAPERDLKLGPILLPNPENAVIVLRELAELNDQALKAEARYNELKELTKTAKEKFDELAKRVLVRLRQTTHQSDLPLLTDLEAGQQAMETAGQSPTGDLPAEEVTDLPGETVDETVVPAGQDDPTVEIPPIDETSTTDAPIEAVEAGQLPGIEPAPVEPADVC